MTFIALFRYGRVFTCEFESSHIVFKVQEFAEARRIVALRAGFLLKLGMKLVFVHRRVTEATVVGVFAFVKIVNMSDLRRPRRQLVATCNVTLHALIFYFLMVSSEFEVGHIVVKSKATDKVLSRMTFGARQVEGFF